MRVPSYFELTPNKFYVALIPKELVIYYDRKDNKDKLSNAFDNSSPIS